MKLFVIAVIILLAAIPASAQPVQITISQPAEATTMDPGRSTQVLRGKRRASAPERVQR